MPGASGARISGRPASADFFSVSEEIQPGVPALVVDVPVQRRVGFVRCDNLSGGITAVAGATLEGL
jgi:hypothetical protein